MSYKLLNESGNIPIGEQCPYTEICKHADPKCALHKDVEFSCGAARFFDMFMKSEQER